MTGSTLLPVTECGIDAPAMSRMVGIRSCIPTTACDTTPEQSGSRCGPPTKYGTRPETSYGQHLRNMCWSPSISPWSKVKQDM